MESMLLCSSGKVKNLQKPVLGLVMVIVCCSITCTQRGMASMRREMLSDKSVLRGAGKSGSRNKPAASSNLYRNMVLQPTSSRCINAPCYVDIVALKPTLRSFISISQALSQAFISHARVTPPKLTSWIATRSWSLILSNSSMHTRPRSASTMAPASRRFSPASST